MQKEEFITALAYAGVSEGSRQVAQDIGSGLQMIRVDKGGMAIALAQMRKGMLGVALADLPDELGSDHVVTIQDALREMYEPVLAAIIIDVVRPTVEAERDSCIAKVAELLQQSS